MIFNISTRMADNTKIIKIKKYTSGRNINECLPQGIIISQTNFVGIHISEIVITSSGDWINKYPDCVVFGINEADTSIPPEGTLCMFCKKQSALHSVKK